MGNSIHKPNNIRENVFCLEEKSEEKTKKLSIKGETKDIGCSLVAFCKSQYS